MKDKILYIVRGIPGSGKSTFAKRLVIHDFLVCEADKYFVDKETGEYNFDFTKIKDAHNSMSIKCSQLLLRIDTKV